MTTWKKGRGALGPLQPLIGRWIAAPGAPGPASAATCARVFEPFGKDYVRLEATWDMGSRGAYREIALFGRDDAGGLAFWSFTSDGKRSQGVVCDGTDVHPQAVAFVAQMPAGTARMIYWPNDTGVDAGDGFRFAVENKVKAGWNRFFEHIYRAAP